MAVGDEVVERAGIAVAAESKRIPTVSGESGEIAGEQAVATYMAALNNPDSLWNVGGMVAWLVADPLP